MSAARVAASAGGASGLCIVMPVRNEGESLAQRLRALRPLRERGAQLVVVDGGSTDATWAVACAHADLVLLAEQGRAAQMNAGARHARADALLFLHADTQLPEDADRLIAQALDGAQWGRFDVRIDSQRSMLRVVERLMNWRSRASGIATGDQAVFMRRSSFEAAGGFAEIALMEDVELSARLKKRSPPACLRQRVVTSARRWERHGVWRTVVLMWRLRAAYFFGADPNELALRYGYSRPAASGAAAAIAVLAKAPLPGWAKTRLIPALGAAGAARAQRGFILRTLHTARSAALGPVALWCAPDSQQRFFRALRRHLNQECFTQVAGDLGQRMQAVFAWHFATHASPLLLIGTDCPVLAPAQLQMAARSLQQHDVVLLPAQDGGYVLIGMRRSLPQAFDGIAWSTPHVLAQTRERLRAAGATWTELDTLWDVDLPADWRRLRQLENGHA